MIDANAGSVNDVLVESSNRWYKCWPTAASVTQHAILAIATLLLMGHLQIVLVAAVVCYSP
jgi:hypothetical protein